MAVTCRGTYLSCGMPRLEIPAASRAALCRTWLVVLALLSTAPLSLGAQGDASSPVEQRTPRRAILGVLGALAGAAGGTVLHRQGSGDTCGACYVGAGALVGGIVGFFIGREADQMYALRYRGAPRLSIPFLELPLDGDPLTLTARDTLVAVATSTGVTMLASARALRPLSRRATGIRNIAAVDLVPRSHALVIATPSGLYVYPPTHGPGIIVREGTIQAAAAADDHVFFAIGARVELAPPTSDTSRAWPGVELHAPVTDLEWDARRRVLWALTDTLLVGLRLGGDGLRVSSRTRVDAGGRSLASGGDRIAIALGGDGVVMIDVSDPDAPREAARWKGARFVYDAALATDRLYAGAGPEGVFVIDASAIPLRTIGLAFDLGFAATLLSRDGYTYILDRRTSSVRRISNPTTR